MLLHTAFPPSFSCCLIGLRAYLVVSRSCNSFHRCPWMRRRVLAQSTERPHSCMPDIFIRVMESFDNSPHVRRRVLAQSTEHQAPSQPQTVPLPSRAGVVRQYSRRVRRCVLAQSTERLLSSTPHDVVITSFVADTPGGARRHASVGGDW